MGKALTIVLTLTFVLFACLKAQESPKGLAGDTLAPCPNSPNCVSSMESREAYHVPPFDYQSPDSIAWQKLLATVRKMKRVKVVTMDDSYAHVEFRSLLFRFVDDVEFWREPADNVIHVRSASRMGYSDLGVNRRRVERIRSLFGDSETSNAEAGN